MKLAAAKRLGFRALVALLALACLGAAGLYASGRDSSGREASGLRLARMHSSPAWKDGLFHNALPRRDGPILQMMREGLLGGQPGRTPDAPVPVQARTRADYELASDTGLRVTWLGHSSLLLELDGLNVLIDPVFGERASPFSWAGPKRFFAPPLRLEELPRIDVVVISHDHYDHLDTFSVRKLAGREIVWAVPLGVGAHLESWGVKPESIRELDWWERTKIGQVELVAAPARHFSGRWLTDQNRTLWAGWAFLGPKHRVFYSGDTSFFDGFVEIGEKLGPFDFTVFEVGAYDAMWADVHLGPEQAVRAHRLVRGSVLLPVHWGLFNLALHGWTEPMERTLAAATREGVRVMAPQPGELFEPTRDSSSPSEIKRWWPTIPWRTVEAAPAFSSGVEALWSQTRP